MLLPTGAWRSLTATFEQYEATSLDASLELSDRATIAALATSRMLRIAYDVRLGHGISEVVVFHGDEFTWEARREDGTLSRPSAPEDSAFDHGIWSLLLPQTLVCASHAHLLDQAQDRLHVRLVPEITNLHVHPDGKAAHIEPPRPSWISAGPALFVDAASHYDALLDSRYGIILALTAVDAEHRPLRRWTLSDVVFNADVLTTV